MMKNLNRLFLLLLLTPLMIAFTGCGDEDTVYGDWVKIGDFAGSARGDAASFVIGNKGYVFAGYDGEDRLYDLWEYDSDTHAWTQIGSCPDNLGRTAAAAFSIGNKGYVGLGFVGEGQGTDGEDYVNTFYEIDIAGNIWTAIEPFPGTARDGAIGFGLQGKGYVGGGFDNDYQIDFYSYDATTGHWTAEGSLGETKRGYGAAFIYNDEAYILGGENSTSVVSEFWKFNPSAATVWTKLRYVVDKTSNDWDDDYTNIARKFPLAIVIGDKAYMTCGSNRAGSLLSETWEYDFATDLWDQKSDFEGVTRTAGVAFSMGTKGYILTGRSSSYQFDDAWQYFPDQEYVKDVY